MNILFIIKSKILLLGKWSYYVGLLNSVDY